MIDLLAIRDRHRRHTVAGESLSAIARDLGVHASSVRWSVRRGEDLVDDPLFEVLGAEVPEAVVEREAPRILLRLREPGAVLVAHRALPRAAVVVDGATSSPTATVEKDVAAAAWARGWLRQSAGARAASLVAHRASEPVGRYVITRRGREVAAALDGRLRSRRAPGSSSRGYRIPEEAVAAGRRLRDKWLCGISIEQEVEFVGPELAAVLEVLVIEELGLEAAERRMGWPARSAKVLLHIALMRLRAFYGVRRDVRRSPDESLPRVLLD